MIKYLLRINEEVWMKARLKAVKLRIPMSVLIASLLQKWAKGEIEI